MYFIKRFYTNTLLLFVLLGTASPLKTFYMSLHSTKNLKKIFSTPGNLNLENEIKDILFPNF